MALNAESRARNSASFHEAIESFAKDVSPEILDQFRDVDSLASLQLALRDIEREQAARMSLRNLKRIDPFLNGLRDYAAVIEVFVNAKPDIMAFIWGPIKFCLQIASKYSQAFDSLIGAYAQIRDCLPDFGVIERLFGSDGAISLLLQHVHTDVLTFHKRAVLFFSKPGWKIAAKLTCRALNDCFGDVLQNLQYSKQLLYTSTDLAHYRESYEARLRTEQAFKEQQAREKQARRLAVHAWLNAFSHKNQQQELETVRSNYPGTGTWLFNHRQWVDWLAGTSDARSGFWVTGVPGAGKTVLFSAMINELQNVAMSAKCSSTIVYVYCKYNDSSRNTFTVLIRSLISSLLERSDAAYDYVYDFAVNSNEQVVADKEVLSTCVLDLLQFHGQVYIGVDGLDEVEWSERAQIVRLIRRVLTDSNELSRPRLFLTSRSEHDLEKAFTCMSRIKLDSSHLTPDIRTYSTCRVGELGHLETSATVLHQLVRDVVDRSEGMFLLAKLTFDMFGLCVTKADFQDEIMNKGLPRGLEEVYHRILERILNQDGMMRRPRASRLLEILTFVRRTLYQHEVQAALSISVPQGDFDLQNPRYTQPFKQICETLVEVNGDDSVVLVHATAKKFLAETSHGMFDSLDANLRFAQTCVAYYSMSFFDHKLHDKDLQQAVSTGCFGFYRYVVCHWAFHAASVLESTQYSEQNLGSILGQVSHILERDFLVSDESSRLGSHFEKVFAKSHDVRKLLDQVKGVLRDTNDHSIDHKLIVPSNRTIERVAAIQKSIEYIIENSQNAKSKEFLRSAYGNRPYLCSKVECPRFYEGYGSQRERNTHTRKHERPYKCHHDDCIFKVTGFSNQSALKSHIESFHMATLSHAFSKLSARSPKARLIDAIADDDFEFVEMICSNHMDAFSNTLQPLALVTKALTAGSNRAAKVLISHFRTKILNRRHWHSSIKQILGATSEIDDAEVVAATLELSDTNLVYSDVRHILDFAIGVCGPRVLEVLLKFVRLKSSRPPEIRGLNSIFENKHFTRAYEVILKCPDVEIWKGDLVETCQTAAERRDHKFLELILAKALAAKVFQGSEWQELLDAPNIEEQVSWFENEEYQRGLVNAIRKGDKDKVSGLVRTRSDANFVSLRHGTPLLVAIYSGHVSILKLLLEKGADPAIHTGQSLDPLCAAAAKGNIKAIESLCDAGAPLDLRGNPKVTEGAVLVPLHYAARNLHHKAVNWSLWKGAVANSTDGHGRNALHHAFHPKESALLDFDHQCPSIVRSLMTARANPNQISRHGETPLGLLIKTSMKHEFWRACREILQILIDHSFSSGVTLKLKSSTLSLWDSPSTRPPIGLLKLLITSGAQIGRGAVINASVREHLAMINPNLLDGMGLAYQKPEDLDVIRGTGPLSGDEPATTDEVMQDLENTTNCDMWKWFEGLDDPKFDISQLVTDPELDFNPWAESDELYVNPSDLLL